MKSTRSMKRSLAAVAGMALASLTTTSPGRLEFAASAVMAAPAPPSYTKDIAPILFKNCATCHRAGEVAPMSLMNYDEVRPWAKAIKAKVVAREMPPWFADPRYGKFSNDRSLTSAQIDAVAAWVDAGAPRGDEQDMPATPDFPALAWKYGEPDLVVESPVEFELPAEGEIDNLNFYVPVPWTGDRFAEKLQMMPGNVAVVHHETASHATLREDLTIVDGKPMGPDGRPVGVNDLRPGGQGVFEGNGSFKLICYVPGRGFEQHWPGTAKRIPGGAGQYITFGVHYQASGRPEKDRSRLGLWFAKEPVTHNVLTQMVGTGGTRLVEGANLPYEEVESRGQKRMRERIPNIPPYADNWKITAITPFPESITLYGFSPHMHLRGKDVKYVLTYPDGKEEILLDVPKYDFNWQLFYELETPMRIPAGSKIAAIGHYDNSLKNKYNPGPEKEVFWSEQSWDEMYEPYIEYTVDSHDLTKMKPAQQQQQH